MAYKNVEIEIQVQVEHPKKLRTFLKSHAQLIGRKRQVDEYFSPRLDDFLKSRPVNQWLRVRDADGSYSMNYKNWYYDKTGKSHYCDEFETKIENKESMKKLLLALNFKPIVVVHKTRTLWNYKNYEVTIDKVKGLGDFVEVEYIGKSTKNDARRVTDGMITFLKRIGCGTVHINYQGYPFMLLFPKETAMLERI